MPAFALDLRYVVLSHVRAIEGVIFERGNLLELFLEVNSSTVKRVSLMA